MPDEHQTNTIIATAILDSFKDRPDRQLDPEEAKILAKRILAALEEAGLQITLADQPCWQVESTWLLASVKLLKLHHWATHL
ncbi:hypothetical protein [Bradyrhizobium sp. AUGA SZCCT0283]|uniref:hypothetical protein n=1 Tax=Bradyrhizobium sp. AUGA SZCCT0283 TaxID=2807671 RepID=UPI001BA70D5B|nr:hypothetical protein [Bradyrhizobium sp. AUGA SZCCT0283]MBR1279648.1 hypothetical protein [Bradyrhizobium sp. AUGA SZCCT0283]